MQNRMRSWPVTTIQPRNPFRSPPAVLSWHWTELEGDCDAGRHSSWVRDHFVNCALHPAGAHPSVFGHDR